MTMLQPVLLAVLAGLLGHQLYRRNEPTVSSFLVASVVLQLGVAYLSARKTTNDRLDLVYGLQQSIVFSVIYHFTLATSISLYRLFFHPLRKIPGPILARLSKWYWFFGFRTGRYYRQVHEMHLIYGPIVRLGPNDVVFFNYEDTWLVNGPASKMSKGASADSDPSTHAKALTFIRDRTEHRIRRRIWDRGFTTAALSNYEPRIAELLQRLVVQLDARSGTELDITSWCSFYAFDAMGDLGFGNDFQMVETGRSHAYREFIHKTFRMRAAWKAVPWFKHMVKYVPVDADMKAKTRDFIKFSNERFNERKKKGMARPDVFSHLLAEDKESGGKIEEADLREDAKSIVLAGSDTTAFTLAMITFCLVEHPEVYGEVQKEIDELEPCRGTALGSDNMPLTVGVINETLRLFPAAPEPTQRTNDDNPMMLNGTYVPPRTNCYVCPWALHHDERYFSKPDEFIPQRWVDELRLKSFNHEVKAWVPFGKGLYNCAGRGLAVLEMRMFLATVLRHVRFEKGPHYDRETFLASLKSNGSMEAGSLYVMVRRRDAPVIMA